MKKSAQRDAKLASGALVNIEQLSKLKNVPVRSLRTLMSKGVLSHYRFGHRTAFFSLDQFDRDIRAYEVKARFANGQSRSNE
jgi:hypothetical protein